MKRTKRLITLLLLSLLLLGTTACQEENNEMPTYEQISAKEAKEIMDNRTDYIIIDTRTTEEFEMGHIENAVNLCHEDVEAKAHVVVPEKDKLILIYCRSGRRSKIAAEALVKLGYTNIKEFGGILDWPYKIVK